MGDDIDLEHHCDLPRDRRPVLTDEEDVWSCGACGTLWMWNTLPTPSWATAAQ